MVSASDIYNFFYSQFLVTPRYPKESCAGKTICVTGANVGLGKEAARHFVRLGADKVIIACRTVEKGEAAKKEIEASEGRTGVVEVWQMDLTSFESVKQFAKRLDGLKRLDVVIENAGIAPLEYSFIEGNEATITTNVVSTFLLALLILPTLRRNAQTHNIQPTLTIVSSEMHAMTDFPESTSANIFDTLNDQATARMDQRYPLSKLLEVLVVRAMAAQKPQPQPYTLNMMNPGLCRSELARDMRDSWAFWLMTALMARTTEVGSRTLVHAGLAGPETHGKYLSDCKVAKPGALVLSPEGAEAQKKFFAELGEKLEAIQPGIMRNL